MNLIRRRFLSLVGGAIAAPALSRIAIAEAYPTRPVTMVIPYGAGGSTDTVGRILAEAMRAPLGQPVVVENLAGASGTVAATRVARARPDGYTFLIGNWATHVLNAAMFTLQYDPQKDFEPVSLVGASKNSSRQVPANLTR
jgi:tripartite-type tricarboxylate transporter receptor subunit TctC